jgi:hypothetical protein
MSTGGATSFLSCPCKLNGASGLTVFDAGSPAQAARLAMQTADKIGIHRSMIQV